MAGKEMKMDTDRQKQAYGFAAALCGRAGKDAAFLERFWALLSRDTEIQEEFCHYMETGQFACRASVKGYTVIDIMVWQIDHFKARLDRRDADTGGGDAMLFLAFDTLLKMKQDPERYVQLMQGETGTDYPDKY